TSLPNALGDWRGGGIAVPQPDGSVAILGGDSNNLNSNANVRIVKFSGTPSVPTGYAGAPLPSFNFTFNGKTFKSGYNKMPVVQAVITAAGKTVFGSGFDASS